MCPLAHCLSLLQIWYNFAIQLKGGLGGRFGELFIGLREYKEERGQRGQHNQRGDRSDNTTREETTQRREQWGEPNQRGDREVNTERAQRRHRRHHLQALGLRRQGKYTK